MPQTSLLGYFRPPVAATATALLANVPPVAGEPKLPQIAQSLDSTASPGTTNDHGSDVSKPLYEPLSSPDLTGNSPGDISRTVSPPKFSEIAIIPVLRSHLPAIQRLTSTLLPVRYPDKFFSGSVDEIIPATFSRVALSMSKPVGWIRCRLDPFPEQTSPPSDVRPIYNRIYVQALCLLAPYRGLGIATALLESILRPRLLLEHDIESIYAHVWECNAEALEWYAKRGFRQVMLVEDYYRKLRPGGAWIVKRDLR
jgi:ribosomal protein S18 acetylase RimI-like enzyme